MKPQSFVFLTLLLVLSFGAQPAAAQIFISEIMFNPAGSPDGPNEYIELRGPASSMIPAGTYLVAIEGDTARGDVQTIFDVSGLSFASNGFLVLLQGSSPYSVDVSATTVVGAGTGWTGVAGFQADGGNTDIENPSAAFMLIGAPAAPTLADDIDSDNDGMADGAVFASWTIIDAVSVLDADAGDPGFALLSYDEDGNGTHPGGAMVVTTAATVNYIARQAGSTGSLPGDWVAGDLSGTAPNWTLAMGATYPPPFDGAALDHIGAENFVGVPVELMSFSIE